MDLNCARYHFIIKIRHNCCRKISRTVDFWRVCHTDLCEWRSLTQLPLFDFITIQGKNSTYLMQKLLNNNVLVSSQCLTCHLLIWEIVRLGETKKLQKSTVSLLERFITLHQNTHSTAIRALNFMTQLVKVFAHFSSTRGRQIGRASVSKKRWPQCSRWVRLLNDSALS